MHFPVNENVIFVDKNEKTWLSIKLNEILSEFNLSEIINFCKKKKKKIIYIYIKQTVHFVYLTNGRVQETRFIYFF